MLAIELLGNGASFEDVADNLGNYREDSFSETPLQRYSFRLECGL
jgi:hypothetical protein